MTDAKIEDIILNPHTLVQLALELKQERENSQNLKYQLGILQEKNKSLSVVNSALIKEENTWDYKSILNALMRPYAGCKHRGQIGLAWDEFYKQLKYKHHIDIKIRQGRTKIKDSCGINFLQGNEIKTGLQTAVAMCSAINMDVGKIINETNLCLIVG